MKKSENELENAFYKIISEHIQQHKPAEEYSIIRQPNLSEFTTDLVSLSRPDFLIMKGKYPFMIVETKANFGGLSNEPVSRWFPELEILGADFYILTDMKQLIVVDRLGGYAFEDSFTILFKLFDQHLSPEQIESAKKYIAQEIQILAEESELPIEQEAFLGKTTKQLLKYENLIENISYDAAGRFFHFLTNPSLGLQNFENQFFQTLLKPVTEQVVCRYTSFDSLYYMLNSGTYRMSSDIAMNDRGEIDYFDKYIGTFYKPLHNLSLFEMQQMNKSFISSCTTINKIDDLTMYRLYAEDTKGVCLCFNVTNGLQSNNMLVKKISYADANGKHLALDLVKNIISSLSLAYSVRFRFLYLDIWKHFFKTYDYTVEDEVRLLYLEDSSNPPKERGWVISNPDKILSKYVLFNLNHAGFPLKIGKIILGPNCPEANLNRRQLEVLLCENNMKSVTVENSKIISYRKN